MIGSNNKNDTKLSMEEKMEFVAIDFETAVGHNSPCAVGIVTVKDGKIVDEYCQLIQPPNNRYTWHTTQVHGLTSADTRNAPDFNAVYPEIKKRLQGKIVVAHNETFDRSVLQKTMLRCGLDYDELQLAKQWNCTVKIFRRKGFHPCNLASLCAEHNLELNHHEALSDARACAQLFLIANNN